MSEVTPELVLVDAELAHVARHELHPPADCLARPRPAENVRWVARDLVGSASAGSAKGRLSARGERPTPSFLAVLGALMTAFVVGSPLLALVPADGERPSFSVSSEWVRQAPKDARATVPIAGPAAVPIRLRWRRVEGADFYDVVLWRDGRRIVDLWPETNALLIGDQSGPAGGALDSGTYQWFAFPAFKETGSTRFGPSVARGEFRIG